MSKSTYSRARKNLDRCMRAYKGTVSRRKFKAFARALNKYASMKRAKKRY